MRREVLWKIATNDFIIEKFVESLLEEPNSVNLLSIYVTNRPQLENLTPTGTFLPLKNRYLKPVRP